MIDLGVLNIPHTCIMTSPHGTGLENVGIVNIPHDTDDILSLIS